MLVRAVLAIDRTEDRKRVQALLGGPGVLVSSLGQGGSLWEKASGRTFDLLVAERSALPEPVTETTRAVRSLPAAPDVIVLSTGEDEEDRAQLLAAGCLAVLHLGLDDDTLAESLRTLIGRRHEQSSLRLQVPTGEQRLGDFVSSSPAMKQLLSVARRVAASDTTLLVLGETGVGKEWLARAIHSEGPRGSGPFLAVNCGAIPEGLLESELFGHKAGAFTGASSDRRGHFELAHGGTLFLDEVGESTSQVQVKLLRVLQEKTIQPLGSERSIDVDVRVMAATNRDPQEEMAEGRLRHDLYYRLGVVTLSVPPLRERREDIPDLVENYFEIYRGRLGQDVYGIDADAMEALVAYDWPGNVRELINVMERAVLLCATEEITIADLPEVIAPDGRHARMSVTDDVWSATGRLPDHLLRKPLRDARRDVMYAFERRYLHELLLETRGRVGETASLAGVSPRALFERMRSLGIRKEDYRSGGDRSGKSPPGRPPGSGPKTEGNRR